MKANSSIGAMSVYDNPKYKKNWEQLIGIDPDDEMWKELRREMAKQLQAAREKVIQAIKHQSYDDLAEIARLLKENNCPFSIITRTTLEQEFSKHCNNGVLMAAKLLDAEGPQEVMLFLLWVVHYSTPSLKPIKRFSKWYVTRKNPKP